MTRFDVTFRDYTAPTGWTLSRALEVLDVRTEEFNYKKNEGADGYSYARTLSIRPDPRLWSVPVIAAHELAHIVLGHTAYVLTVENMGLPSKVIPFNHFELEAHAVARAVTLGLGISPAERQDNLVQRYIDLLIETVGDLDEYGVRRLSEATLTILEAGEDRASRLSDQLQEAIG